MLLMMHGLTITSAVAKYSPFIIYIFPLAPHHAIRFATSYLKSRMEAGVARDAAAAAAVLNLHHIGSCIRTGASLSTTAADDEAK